MTTSLQPASRNQRIDALDVLRGIAIFGMIIAHSVMFGIDNGSTGDKIVGQMTELFIDGQFYTIFAILFGAGYAIQFMNSNNKGERFIPRFIRRMFALACFGFLIELLFGFSVLIEYAFAGLLLLFMQKWSTKLLIITLFIFCTAGSLYNLTYAAVFVAKHGKEKYIPHMQERGKQNASFNKMEEDATTYKEVIIARFKRIQFRYADPLSKFFWTLSGDLVYFLLGFIGMRLGVFENPAKRRRLIGAIACFGIVSWAVTKWAIPLLFPPSLQNIYPNISFVKALLIQFGRGLGFIRYEWLCLGYISIVLLLVSYNLSWLRMLRFFSWPGRMALTNYMLQAIVFGLLFWKYALSVPVFADGYAPLVALLLFGVLVLFSRWWFTHNIFGPLEWIWRSFTYWKWQPMKKMVRLN